jgi:hypothetical protein
LSGMEPLSRGCAPSMFAKLPVVVGLFCDYSLGTVPMEAGCRLTCVSRVSALELVVRL